MYFMNKRIYKTLNLCEIASRFELIQRMHPGLQDRKQMDRYKMIWQIYLRANPEPDHPAPRVGRKVNLTWNQRKTAIPIIIILISISD